MDVFTFGEKYLEVLVTIMWHMVCVTKTSNSPQSNFTARMKLCWSSYAAWHNHSPWRSLFDVLSKGSRSSPPVWSPKNMYRTDEKFEFADLPVLTDEEREVLGDYASDSAFTGEPDFQLFPKKEGRSFSWPRWYVCMFHLCRIFCQNIWGAAVVCTVILRFIFIRPWCCIHAPRGLWSEYSLQSETGTWLVHLTMLKA